ncbi:DUF4262 domain-containing protein [Streptomyces sp. NPDC058751]|uniref:DUF4262 domain-containing protein n=1 Tax=Streptomyces sp. NPDC058751 TaxID=3346623 RepID=UPI0036A5F4F1
MSPLDVDERPRVPETDFIVVAVHDMDGDEPFYAYSVGLAQRPGRAYELACVGVVGPLAQVIIRRAAEQLQRDLSEPAEHLELDQVVNGDPVRLHRVRDASRFSNNGPAPTCPFWQILLPDAWGRFPGDLLYPHGDEQSLL